MHARACSAEWTKKCNNLQVSSTGVEKDGESMIVHLSICTQLQDIYRRDVKIFIMAPFH